MKKHSHKETNQNLLILMGCLIVGEGRMLSHDCSCPSSWHHSYDWSIHEKGSWNEEIEFAVLFYATKRSLFYTKAPNTLFNTHSQWIWEQQLQAALSDAADFKEKQEESYCRLLCFVADCCSTIVKTQWMIPWENEAQMILVRSTRLDCTSIVVVSLPLLRVVVDHVEKEADWCTHLNRTSWPWNTCIPLYTVAIDRPHWQVLLVLLYVPGGDLQVRVPYIPRAVEAEMWPLATSGKDVVALLRRAAIVMTRRLSEAK